MSPYGHQLRANGPINYFERYIMTQIYSFISNRSFKYLVLAVLAICSACSSDPMPDTEEGKTPIGFGVTASRAPISAASDIQAFKVWARFSNSQTPEMTLMEREVVYRDPEDTNVPKRFTYDNTKYWVNGNYQFYAVHPESATVKFDEENSYTFTIKDYVTTGTDDLMLASVPHEYPTNGSTVNLAFSHLLTKVSLQLNKSDNNASNVITVTDAYLYGVHMQGTCTLNGGTPQWSELADVSNVGQSDLTKELTTEYTSVLENYMLLPQKISNDNPIYLVVLYQYKQSESSNAIEKNLIVPMPHEPVWAMNSSIVYKATIKVDHNIVFSTPVVEPWGNEQAGGTIIIK